MTAIEETIKDYKGYNFNEALTDHELEHLKAVIAECIKPYEEVLEDNNRVIRMIDVVINGWDGSAEQASLIDIRKQLEGIFESKRYKVYKIIDGERDYQDSKWGVQTDRAKPTESFIVYMKAYLDQAVKDISFNSGDAKALDTLRKVVSLGIACFEIHGVPERTIESPQQSAV